jgi:YebC/PmpR family DNA-binding regulatory protein
MAGHSKWAKVKRQKAVTDVRKSKIFTKALREVQVAARLGGANVEGNYRLKTAIAAARAVSVPNDNIDKAVKRGSGTLEDTNFEDVTYEGYGPGGVAVLVKALTDNRNRTASDVRHAFTRFGGSLGGVNSVAFTFAEKGVLQVKKGNLTEDKIIATALDAGAEDVSEGDENWEVVCPPNTLANVQSAVEKSATVVEAGIKQIPSNWVTLQGEKAEQMLELVDALEDLDDVQNVFANCEIGDV